ncbi:MAG TPA: phosphoglycolate phosphatase, partial [Sulfurimonas autotrophica]|nr:phosphoglycolate phosphatase [Sulfurimonas autotrophica]
MKSEHKELLIFDLDGTLINSAPDLSLAVNHM